MIDSSYNDVALIVCHKLDDRIITNYRKIALAFHEFGKTYLLYQNDNIMEEDIPSDVAAIGFGIDDLCSLGYQAWAETIVPGSNHFILLWFYNNYPQYYRYWNIEYDVEFAGDWKYIFNRFYKSDADFISCHIMRFMDDPGWYWWKAIKTVGYYIPLKQRIRSFNPIYRISKRGITFLHEKLSNGFGGHHEVVIPTMLYFGGFRIEDFGGIGEFVKPENRGLHYDASSPFPWGTMRHKPDITLEDIKINSNFLYHPIK